MHARKSLVNAGIALVVMMAVAGCSTMVTIQSEPPGADIILNNQKVGTTPFAVKLSDFAFNSYDVTLKKDGYSDFHGSIAKEAKAGAIIGGLFVWVPFLWCYGPQPYQTFYLSEKDSKVGAAVVNKAENVVVRIDDTEIGAEAVTVSAGVHTVTFVRANGDSVSKEAEFMDGNWYEFRM